MLFRLIRRWLINFRILKIKFATQGNRCKVAVSSSIFTHPNNIYMGDDNHIGRRAHFDSSAKIQIGKGNIFGPNVTIYTRTHNYNSNDLGSLPFDNKMILSEVIIEDYVWIASNVVILPGVKIGNYAVIGASAVVSKSVPDYAVVVGNPGKVIKYRNKERVEELIASGSPFIYHKFGHEKVTIKKDSNPTAQQSF